MADTRKITIEIITSDANTGQVNVVNNYSTTEVNSAKGEGKTLLKSVILNQSYQTAKKLTIQTVEANINHYLTLSEDYIAQNTVNNVKTVINKVTSAGSTIMGGVTSGATVGGFAGAIVGGVIATVGYGVSEYISYQSRMSGYYASLNASNIETNYAQRRAGYTNGSRGTEN